MATRKKKGDKAPPASTVALAKLPKDTQGAKGKHVDIKIVGVKGVEIKSAKNVKETAKEAPVVLEDTVEELSGEEQLLTIGREKSYVTYDDILSAFPDAEKNLEQMEDVFAALADAGIQIVPSEDEAADQIVYEDDDDEDEFGDHNNENLLEAIEADDTVGLYLKEIGRVPLLTATQEVDLAQRMERGQGGP